MNTDKSETLNTKCYSTIYIGTHSPHRTQKLFVIGTCMLPPTVFIALLTAVLMVPVVPFITALMVPIRLLMKTPHAATVGKFIKQGI